MAFYLLVIVVGLNFAYLSHWQNIFCTATSIELRNLERGSLFGGLFVPALFNRDSTPERLYLPNPARAAKTTSSRMACNE